MQLGIRIAIALAWLAAATPALAESISFIGNYTLTDPGNDGFSEELTFDNPFGLHSGAVTLFDPVGDALFSDAGVETVEIATLYLDTSDTTDPFSFSPSFYADGFKIYDDDGTPLLTADLSVVDLDTSGASGLINPFNSANLSNLVLGGSYTTGDSAIIDAFLAAGVGAFNLTLQLPNIDVEAAINAGDDVESTYSGTATVAEPTSWLMISSGLAGLAFFERRHRRPS